MGKQSQAKAARRAKRGLPPIVQQQDTIVICESEEGRPMLDVLAKDRTLKRQCQINEKEGLEIQCKGCGRIHTLTWERYYLMRHLMYQDAQPLAQLVCVDGQLVIARPGIDCYEGLHIRHMAVAFCHDEHGIAISTAFERLTDDSEKSGYRNEGGSYFMRF